MNSPAFVLIYDADADRAESLRDALRVSHDFPCRIVDSIDSARESLRERAPNVVVARLDGRNGQPPADKFAALADALEEDAPDASLVVIGLDSPAKRRGLSIVPLASESDRDQIVAKIARAAQQAVARREDRLLRLSLENRPYEVFEGIVGESPAIRRIIDRIKKVADKGKLSVLILGETGTGKDVIARAIHNRSARAKKPFVPVNCAAFSESLLESQLFGHVKGAFTGAFSDQKGLFAAADAGTIFLDEIGDMPHHLQAKLLRVLEYREFTPLGSTELRRVDVRIIAATNADLRRKVEQKEFREDLYYRLHHVEIRVPPLRDRRQDIPLLAQHFLSGANESLPASVPGFSSEALQAMLRYLWPGNIRELKNMIEAVAAEVDDRQIELIDLPERIRGTRELATIGPAPLVGVTIAQMERLMIEKALEHTQGNRDQAAKMLGIGTRTLYRKLKEFGL